MLILADDGLWFWDDQLGRSPINDTIDSSQLRTMAAHSGDLWLASDTEVSLWRDGWLHSVTVGDSPAAPPFAISAPNDTRPTVWASSEAGLVALESDGDGSGASWTVSDFRPGLAPVSLAVDSSGAVWAAADGKLYNRAADGTWTIYELPSSVLSVAANPAAAQVWIQTESDVIVHRDGEFLEVNGVPTSTHPWEADDIGRLLIGNGSGVSRVSVGRPVAVVGMPKNGLLFAAAEILIAPTDGESVVELSASFGGESLSVQTLQPGVWTAEVDPEKLDAGAYDFDVSVEYSDNTEAGHWSLIVADPTWEEDIFPLYVKHCSICHNGSSGSAVLDTLESWETRFDDLIDRVSRNNMPLGRTPLSDFEKGLVRAWGAKDFPR